MSDNSKITLGKTLRDARIAKGYTLDDLQQTTKIQKRYLIAIEDQNFDELPGDFYVRAFIKQYADMVDLDGAELLKQFDSALPSTQTQEYVDKVNENNPETRSQQRQVDERYVKLRRTIPVVGIVIVVLVILVGIWVAASHNGSSTTKNNVDSSSVSVSGSSSNKTQSSSKSSSSKKSSSKKAKTASFKKLSSTTSGSTWEMLNASSKPKMSLSATTSAWMSVTANGSTVWQGTLSSTTSHSLTIPSSATSVTLKFGNAPATSVKVDGKKFNFTSATSTSSASSSSSTTGTTTTTSSSSTTTTSSQVQTVTLEFK
ncbi:helix-turn-helix domain-containing protein [Levilactobacillus cerevisiae]|uniref:helix-turn-helix domain-containing protein n=1 Tax=Levilactobacillus cerevisiae TaxID=1704076 RepID=UPI000F7A2FC4|nr:helix-turn-helix domain-containing protein [Levilactobacillus cerevisiae]